MITQQDVLEVGRMAEKLGAVSGPAFRRKYGAGMYYSWVWWQIQVLDTPTADAWLRWMLQQWHEDLFPEWPLSDAALGWILVWGAGLREKRLRITRKWREQCKAV